MTTFLEQRPRLRLLFSHTIHGRLPSSSPAGIWVTYKDGVYDVTKFVEQHPGGMARIMLAAGGAIDPFWAMYQQHNTDQVGGSRFVV